MPAKKQRKTIHNSHHIRLGWGAIIAGGIGILMITYTYFNSSTFIVGSSQSANVLPTDIPSSILWMANHENGNMDQWKWSKSSKPWQDSGLCKRPKTGVSTDVSHTGSYSLKMSIKSWFPHSGCRQFRSLEGRTGQDLYYSAWLYFPEKYKVDGWTNVMQFKSKRKGEQSKPSSLFWSVRMKNRENGNMYYELSWKGGEAAQMLGPTAEDTTYRPKQFTQTIKDIPEKQWTHLEIFLKQSGDFDGQIIVWQDGVEIFNMQNIRTQFPEGTANWSVNSYGAGIKPSTYTIYVDDAVISTERIGPDFNNFTAE